MSTPARRSSTPDPTVPRRRSPAGVPLVRVNGHSYPADTYDGIVPTVLAHVAANASVQASVVGLLEERTESVDSLALARIAKEREAAMARYLRDRDPLALETAMTRLDQEEAEARSATKTVDPNATLAYLADLPRLWRETAPERHRNLAEAMFEQIEVLGTREAIIHPTSEAEAHGWRELLGDAVLSADHRGRYGRGEKASASAQQSLRFLMINRTPRESVPVAAARSA